MVPPDWAPKTRQPRTCGTSEWRSDYARRVHVESFDSYLSGTTKDDSDLRRSHTHVLGRAPPDSAA